MMWTTAFLSACSLFYIAEWWNLGNRMNTFLGVRQQNYKAKIPCGLMPNRELVKLFSAFALALTAIRG